MIKTIEELESAVASLSAQELSHFSKWFEEFMADQWDRKIEADILEGRLDAAGKRADDDLTQDAANRFEPLCNT